LYAALVNLVVSAPGSPAKSQSQNTRWHAAWPRVTHSGHRSADGRSASCSGVIVATTSRRRRLTFGHVLKAGRIVGHGIPPSEDRRIPLCRPSEAINIGPLALRLPSVGHQHDNRTSVVARFRDIDKARVDTWLWAVRLYKTRSAATAACRGGHVRVNGASAKASTHVKVGDRVETFVDRKRILEVAVVIDKRVAAAAAAACIVDHSPPAPVVRRQPPVFVRERGAGRPTKRERRELDRLRRR
jgi:ribosome-associated heat shock protein Hsp15